MQPNSYFGGGTESPIIYNQNTRRPNRRKILIIVLAVLFVATILAVLSVALGGTKSSGEKLADKFVSGIVSGDVDSTFTMLSPQAQTTETKVGWQQKTSALKGFFSSYESTEQNNTDQSDSDYTSYGYIAKGSDGLYQITVLVDEERGAVESFNSEPYIDVEGRYK